MNLHQPVKKYFQCNADWSTAVVGEADIRQHTLAQQWSNLSYTGRICVIYWYISTSNRTLSTKFLPNLSKLFQTSKNHSCIVHQNSLPGKLLVASLMHIFILILDLMVSSSWEGFKRKFMQPANSAHWSETNPTRVFLFFSYTKKRKLWYAPLFRFIKSCVGWQTLS